MANWILFRDGRAAHKSACLLTVALMWAGSLLAQNHPTPGTKRMTERLQEIAHQTNVMNNVFQNRVRAALLETALKKITNSVARLNLGFGYANELLNAGMTAEALKQTEELDRALQAQTGQVSPKNKLALLSLRAIAYLRLGEQQNCLSNHNTDSCLLPIQGGGVHKLQGGSRSAIAVLNQLLKDFPDDLAGRWLLNLAYMTLGEYPDKVPATWLIPPQVFASDAPFKRFYDVAGGLCLDLNRLSGGAILEDFDADGNLDLMVSSIGLNDPLRYFHNNADGTFTDWTEKAGLMGEFGGLNIMQTDYDNDGYADVLVLRGGWMRKDGHFPLSLLHNIGDGIFDDVTEKAGLLRFHPTQAAVWFDFNNDGLIDLFVGNESTEGDTRECELFRNNDDGTFTECAASCGVAAIGFVKGVASADFNNDGLPDLYLSRMGQPNILFRNDGPRNPNQGIKSDWSFTDISNTAGVSEQHFTFPCWFFDYDNDGWPDLFVSGYQIRDTSVNDVAADYLGLPTNAERARLYHNNHDGTFTDVSRETGLYKVLMAMGSNFGDLDNDGHLDFYLGTGTPSLNTLMPNRMFRNAEGKFFQDITTAGGFGHLQKRHGVAFGDIDNDGDQDIYEDMGGAFSGDTAFNVLYQNPGFSNHWLTLKLEGVQSNRAAFGARIKVIVETEKGDRSIYKTVGTGGSFGASPLRQEIGLGQAKSIRAVEIFWPVTGKTQILKNVDMDHFYKVREGAPDVVLWNLKSFKLTSGESKPHIHHHESMPDKN